MSTIRQCFLKCLLDTHAPIKLSHNTEIIIGRSKETKIKDQSCSRRQISLKADCQECEVELKPLGINPSGLDGFALKPKSTYKVGHGSRIELLVNEYIHVIEFDPPPEGFDQSRISLKRKLDESESTSSKAKSSKIDMEESIVPSESTEDVWESVDHEELYVFATKGLKSSKKIAGFDMDGTLITPKSGKVYPVDTKDWKIAFPTVIQKLKEYFENGYKIAILSNQAPIGKGRVKIEDFKKKIEALAEKLNVPVQVFMATGKTFYRKPAIGMWKYLAEKKNDNIEIDMKESFYCGDAAGRPANWAPGKKKDHSMADKLLAENLGLKFYTPEQLFLGHSVANIKMINPEFLPNSVKSEPFNENLISKNKEILVLVGYPGSGKSFLAKQIEKRSDYKYKTVCRDVMGTWQKCAAEAKKLLETGKSVIVDSTNPDVESRSRWLSLAKEMNVPCRCAKMAASKAQALHNNKFREIMKQKHLPVSEIVFHTYKKNFVEPTTNEGFKEIIVVNFNPCFGNAEAEKIYRMHLLEK